MREILLLCILVYFSQGALFAQGTIITQLALILILGISSYYFLKVMLLQKQKSVFIWAWSLLLSVNVLGYLFTLDLANSVYISQIKAILMFLLPFFPFYYLGKKGKINESHLLRFFIIMLVLTILNFSYEKEVILASRISGNTNVVNNISYQFVVLLPYIFLFKNRIFSILGLSIILVFTIQAAKRGALIVSVIGAIFFVYHQLRTVDAKNRIRGYFLAFSGLVFSAFYLYQYFLSNEYLILRLTQIEEGGSGRDTIFLNLLSAWYNSDNIFNYIFGHGFASTIRLSSTGNFAHNDWLELLVNFGLLGFVLYIAIFYGLLKLTYKKGFIDNYRIIILTITSIWFVTTLFSMIYTSNTSMIITVLLASLIGKKAQRKRLESF